MSPPASLDIGLKVSPPTQTGELTAPSNQAFEPSLAGSTQAVSVGAESTVKPKETATQSEYFKYASRAMRITRTAFEVKSVWESHNTLDSMSEAARFDLQVNPAEVERDLHSFCGLARVDAPSAMRFVRGEGGQ